MIFLFTFSFDSEKNLKTFTPIQNSLENSEVLKTIQELALLREKHLNEANTQKNSVVSQEGNFVQYILLKPFQIFI